ncbi:MAG: hypothetical protein SGPRY_001776, partial [Prymnesium sp.]
MPLLCNPFSADSRSLAAFRACLGGLVAWEALSLLADPSLLTDHGPLPLSVLHARVWQRGSVLWSLHAMSGGEVVIRLLLCAQFCFALSLALAYRPRASALCCWALVTSAGTRNPLATHGGDSLLRIELLLASLIPLKPSQCSRRVSSLPVGLLLFQPLLMYFVAATLKCSHSWRDQLTAVHLTLHLDMAAKPLAVQLRRLHWLTRLASLLTPYVELCAPLLLLCPIARARRWAVAIGLAILLLLQLSFLCCLVLGNFPWISTISIIPFLPSSTWNRWWEPRRESNKESPVARRVSSGAAAMIGCWVLLWNVEHHCTLLRAYRENECPDCSRCLSCSLPVRMPFYMRSFGELLALHQSWDLFAPEVSSDVSLRSAQKCSWIGHRQGSRLGAQIEARLI